MLHLEKMYRGDVYYPNTQKVYNLLYLQMNEFKHDFKKFEPNHGFRVIDIQNGNVIAENNGGLFNIPWIFFQDSFGLEKSKFAPYLNDIAKSNGVVFSVALDMFEKGEFNETSQPIQVDSIKMDRFFQVARDVKPRRKENVVLHLASEVGEIAECLEQPERGGNIVEESIDAILCGLDLIFLELGTTHGHNEIVDIINKTIATKLQKWHDTKKK